MRRKLSDSSDDELNFTTGTGRSDPLLYTKADGYADLDKQGSIFGDENPYQKAGIFSRWLFNWVTPLVRFGYKEQIKLEHLSALPDKYDTAYQENKLAVYWDKYKHNKTGYPLIKAIFMAYKGEFFYAFLLSFISSLPEIAIPFVIQRFLDFIDDPNEGVWIGILFAFLYVALSFLSRVIMEQGTFFQMQLGSKCSAGLIALIYDKALKISSSTNKKFTQGEIVNFIQVDAKKIIMFAWRLPGLSKLPIILIYCIIMCFIYFSYTFYSGCIFIVCTIAVNYVLAIFTARRQAKVLTAKDSRMRLITETINSIKIIKLNSWIERFMKQIKKLRDTEIWMLKLRFSLTLLNLLAIFLLPSFLILTVFSVAIRSGIRFRASTAFAALQVLNLLRDPTRWLPFFIGVMMEFGVSMKRIQVFLQGEEINHKMLEYDKNMAPDQAILISGANFSWGGEKIDDNEEKDKEKEKELKKIQKEAHKAIRENERKKSEDLEQNSPKRYMINDEEESKDNLSDSSSPSEEETLSTSSSGKKKDMLVKDIITLKNIGLDIKKGEFVCIIGEIGSGKSSLINAILSDLIYVSDETVSDLSEKVVDDKVIEEIFDRSRHEGIIKASGSLSYVQQIPWIQNKTIRDNILFENEMDEDRYNRTVETCQLAKDFEQLDGGDLTEIGEKGINLSGGQKARVSLARAVYAQKDIILMDDPISALDAGTKAKIFDQVFDKDLQGKTRILVTHAVDFLDRVDRIIIMDHCKIKYIGTYEELQGNEVIQHIIETLKKVSQKEEEEEVAEIQEIELQRKTSSEGSDSNKNKLDSNELDGPSQDDNKQISYLSEKSSKITSDEFEEKVSVDWNVYFKYFCSNGTWIALFSGTFLIVVYAWCGIQTNRFIGRWIGDIEEEGSFSKYLWTIIAYSIGFGISISAAFVIIMLSVLRSSNNLHRNMVKKTLMAPINLYFDKTPTGKLLNRYSKDINKMDADMPFLVTFVIECLSWVGATIFITALISPWSLISIPFVMISGAFLIRYYIRSFREMTRIESVTNSPILSNFGETITGATTIRCFKNQKKFIKTNYKLVDDNLNSFFWVNSLNIWFSIRLQYISSIMMIVSLGFCIGFKYSSDIETVGTLLIYLLMLQANVLWFFRIASEMEGAMVSYDRCDQILKIPQEAFNTHPLPPSSWPTNGKIVFDNICLRYRPETELVLRNLSFEIEPGQKVGVIGRTGAGKSTVCLALCRIIECESGSILIDGVDIKNIDLAALRKKITIIPQDPILFEGSLKFNLDPEENCDQATILRLVSKAKLQELWDSGKEIASNGENLSSGEKQLICICRAILRKSKIILMDEATANIDIKTEEIIQKLIIEEFKESTVITIAHRLNTILNSDKVLILEKGELVHREIDDFREYFA
ncbi:unnamed protein product [Moneuplotes crassus]|uniref:Uncharacterized protein n=2 Tax=Euplotes crassus TaxID=5936 RepID=A0AAD1X867_EUPCR|nr:unnamed protein product [Moneuplotes crassus]